MEPLVKLKHLLKEFPEISVKGSKELVIKGITANSKQVAPGYLFIAKKGLTRDGSEFIKEAVQNGAVAVLTDLFDPFLDGVVQLVHPKPQEIEARLIHTYYNHPAAHLFLIGVTGTSGKTTTASLIKHVLGEACGLIGTIESVIGSKIIPSTHTTPDLATAVKYLHEMICCKNTAAVMEVSSHGIEQGRISGIDFDAAVFTNLTPEHLDYHETMEKYAAAKSKLFASLKKEAVALYNTDDPHYKSVLKECKAQTIGFGFSDRSQLRASNLILDAAKISFDVAWEQKLCHFTTQLMGRFNVYNLLAAIGVGLIRGFSLEQIQEKLIGFMTVPGRLERIENNLGVHVFVDYAHKEDALKHVLQALQEFKKGRLITVFGCGGNRDPFKRPKMAAAAEQFSDQVIVTNDNPRFEDPEEIARQVVSGFTNPDRCLVELDRKKAIKQALSCAQHGDIVLIAGKGHETYQIFGHKTVHFDDREVAREVLLELERGTDENIF